ncbi:helicase [Neisseria arctica]|uniref:Helicase n=1 Tax=Neisseria arctica TaxID=1470200 RepID=A0A0J0YT03_9NEIS|nr:helicase [Neisseria arctica]
MAALAEDTAIIIDPATIKPFTPESRFVCDNKGVWWVEVKNNSETGEPHEIPLRLSDTIDLIGSGQDVAGNYYRVIQYRDKITRQNKIAVIPTADIGSNQGWQRLQSWGITIYSGRRKRELLADYLQTEGSKAAYTITEKAGWHDKAYILPSGEVIHTGEEAARIIYNGDKSQAAAYLQSGSLEQWQAEIARYAAGNSRLCLALGIAFAAPLLSLLNVESGGFHLYGDSSDGKTTAARVALSVWGKPSDILMTWQGTGLAFSNTAAARNDGLLVLDEIGQATPTVVSSTVYGIMNGVNKAQGAKDGGNRHQSRWRVLVLSTGEKTPDTIMRGTADWHAGQSARLPSIPAAAQYGIYDTLHGFSSGAELSEHLQAAATNQHGNAGRAFIRLLDDTAKDRAEERIKAFMDGLPELSGQARRVAKRFALIAAALELAAPVTGLAAGVGMAGIKQCFDAWLARTGSGKQEDKQIIQQAEAFMQMHGDSLRFIGWNDAEPYVNRNHAGYRKSATQENSPDEFWIIPAVFESEICQSFDTAKVCAVLHGIEWLKKPDGTRWRHQRKGKGRFYVLVGLEPPSDEVPESE